jgi:hypothetical protein
MDSNPSNNWSPARQHVRSTSVSTSKSVSTPVSTPLRTSTSTSTLNSPGNPLAPVLSQKQYRGGYEVKPKALTFKPYALNNPGTPTQAAFNLSKQDPIQSIDALDPEQWSKLAVEMELLPPGAELHAFQVQVCNLVLMRRGDCVLISPTGSGKSLTWTLPLTARKEGISLVITPFTSLGQEGELLYVFYYYVWTQNNVFSGAKQDRFHPYSSIQSRIVRMIMKKQPKERQWCSMFAQKPSKAHLLLDSYILHHGGNGYQPFTSMKHILCTRHDLGVPLTHVSTNYEILSAMKYP